MEIRKNNTAGEVGAAIGKGLLAGLVATAAITISQMIEMKITKRKPSEAPVKVASQVTGIEPAKGKEETVSQEIHWAYGTGWGIVRGFIGLTGLTGIPATLLHFAAIWGTELVMLPALDAAPPVTEEKPGSIAVDALHHAVYAIVAGVTYTAIDAGFSTKNFQKKANRSFRKIKRIF